MLGATWVADIWDDPKKRLLSWEEKKANVPVYKRIYHETQGALISFYLKRADMGKIVVASRLPRIAKIIEHGKTGFLYDPHDTAAAAEIIGKIKKIQSATKIWAQLLERQLNNTTGQVL